MAITGYADSTVKNVLQTPQAQQRLSYTLVGQQRDSFRLDAPRGWSDGDSRPQTKTLRENDEERAERPKGPWRSNDPDTDKAVGFVSPFGRHRDDDSLSPAGWKRGADEPLGFKSPFGGDEDAVILGRRDEEPLPGIKNSEGPTLVGETEAATEAQAAQAAPVPWLEAPFQPLAPLRTPALEARAALADAARIGQGVHDLLDRMVQSYRPGILDTDYQDPDPERLARDMGQALDNIERQTRAPEGPLHGLIASDGRPLVVFTPYGGRMTIANQPLDVKGLGLEGSVALARENPNEALQRVRIAAYEAGHRAQTLRGFGEALAAIDLRRDEEVADPERFPPYIPRGSVVDMRL